jgi:hypothetical protein
LDYTSRGKEVGSEFVNQLSNKGGKFVCFSAWQLADEARKKFKENFPRVLYNPECALIQHPAPLFQCRGIGSPMHEGLATTCTHELNAMTQLGVSLGAFNLPEDSKMVLYRCPGVPP